MSITSKISALLFAAFHLFSTTGAKFPGTGANDAGIGATAWTSVTNIGADDNATAACSAGASSQYLVAKNFTFDLPAGAVIKGIIVKIGAAESSTGTESLFAQLQDDAGTLTGSSKSNTINGTGETIYTYGTATNLWGTTTLTQVKLTDVDFGVRFWYTTSHNITIDYVTMEVFYYDKRGGFFGSVKK